MVYTYMTLITLAYAPWIYIHTHTRTREMTELWTLDLDIGEELPEPWRALGNKRL